MDDRVNLVIRLMQKDLRRELPLEALATAASVSPSRLHQLFKDVTGTSPARYLRLMRLERARELLEKSPYGVKQVMVAVGVKDRSHFERDFKSFYGMTPSKYRRADFGARHVVELDARRVTGSATKQEFSPQIFCC